MKMELDKEGIAIKKSERINKSAKRLQKKSK